MKLLKQHKSAPMLLCGLGCLVLILLPFFSSQFTLTILIRFMYFGLLTISFSFLAGQLGLFSLMVPVSFALTAYAIAICDMRGWVGFPWSMLIGIVIALVFAGISGIMVNNTSGTSFLMLTLVLSQLVWSIILQWTDLTNGATGIVGVKFPEALKIFSDRPNFNQYYWALIMFLICAALVYFLSHSSSGLRLRGIRDSESRMKSLGYNTAFLKWSAFVWSSFFSCVSGILFVYYTGIIEPNQMNLTASNQALISSILGGAESLLFGSMLGTVINRMLELVLGGMVQRYATITGCLFLLIILVIPNGLTSVFKKLLDRLQRKEERK